MQQNVFVLTCPQKQADSYRSQKQKLALTILSGGYLMICSLRKRRLSRFETLVA